MTDAIRVESLSKWFRRGWRHPPLVVLDTLTFAVAKGEALGLAGPSGAGKSTLIRLMVGLDQPSTGTVLIDGMAAWNLPRRRQLPFRRLVQPVFQNPGRSLNPSHRIGTILNAPLIVHGIGSRSERRDRVRTALAAVELDPGVARFPPAALSGGERQRVAIARALITDPRIIVADEPTASLDTVAQAAIVDLLCDIRQRRAELTIVIASHNPALLQRLCDRVLTIHAATKSSD